MKSKSKSTSKTKSKSKKHNDDGFVCTCITRTGMIKTIRAHDLDDININELMAEPDQFTFSAHIRSEKTRQDVIQYLEILLKAIKERDPVGQSKMLKNKGGKRSAKARSLGQEYAS